MTISLTPVQHAILAYAINNTGGRIEWFPPNIKGGAQQKVLKAMSDRHLIRFVDPGWQVDAAGYDALGLQQPDGEAKSAPNEPAPELAEINAQTQEQECPVEPVVTSKPTPRTRDNSKQAAVIALLSRPEGATLAQITEATQWQLHTTRGFLAGAVKKRLGLQLTSEKPEGGVRIYRVIG